ncbi:hypothetical protein MHK_005273 [Candidatus Magnetomorum sp. HK-1]|nr:hypothetical protein MHK_005273 [Candidatus Magnetomorum sp. HK-1]
MYKTIKTIIILVPTLLLILNSCGRIIKEHPDLKKRIIVLEKHIQEREGEVYDKD